MPQRDLNTIIKELTNGQTVSALSVPSLTVTGDATIDGALDVVGNLTKNGNTVWHAGNDGSGTGLDADTVDTLHATSFLRSDTYSSITNTSGNPIYTQFFCRSNSVVDSATAYRSALEVKQDTTGADAYMTFHVSGDYAAYFGLAGDVNDFVVGGWSMGANKYRVWHSNQALPVISSSTATPAAGTYLYLPAGFNSFSTTTATNPGCNVEVYMYSGWRNTADLDSTTDRIGISGGYSTGASNGYMRVYFASSVGYYRITCG